MPEFPLSESGVVLAFLVCRQAYWMDVRPARFSGSSVSFAALLLHVSATEGDEVLSALLFLVVTFKNHGDALAVFEGRWQ